MDFYKKRIMVVVAHPDDELLGCGGTMHRLSHEYGCIIRAVILGEGLTSRSVTRDIEKWERDLKVHRQNIEDARTIIGYDSVGIYDLPDNRFDSVDLLDIIKLVEKEKIEFKPEIIFTHHGGDLNIDHQRTFEAVVTATRPLENETVQMVITFETPSNTEWRFSQLSNQFCPNLFVDVSHNNISAKIQAMECYEFEKRKYPHPRSPESLSISAKKNGILVGSEYAEAFSILRMVFR